jgi:type I restriction enzyme, S subunit
MPSVPPPNGWQWAPLTELAQLESGHTPSRRHPEYWEGKIPWIGIQDAKANDGGYITETLQHTNDLGIANSSARVLPENTVCLSRTASVEYVVVMGRPMATSQDFVNWVCSKQLDHEFLKYVFIAEGDGLLRFSSGAVHQTIYFPEVKAFHICLPPLPEQRRIVGILDEAFEGIASAKANAEKNLQNTRALFESHLNSVFACASGLCAAHTSLTRKRSEGWVNQRLGDLATFRNGINFTKASRGDSIKIVGVKDFQNNYWAPPPDALDTVTTDGALPDSDLLKPNDVLFVRSNGNMELIGRCLLVGAVTDKITHSGFTIRARLKGHEVRPRYLCHFLKSSKARRAMIDSGIGTNIKSLNQATLSELVIPFPPCAEQSRIVNEIEALSTETQRLASIYRQKLAALDELKKSLLQRAFAGEL